MDKRVEIKASLYSIEGTLKEASERFRELVSQIPVEYRDRARVDYEHEDDYYGCQSHYVVLSYYRPETSTEEAFRLKEEENRDNARRERDQKEFERLSKLFGNQAK